MTEGGAFYLIAVPPNWNGDLVIWNHGFTLDPPAPLTDEDLGPLKDIQLAEGYAVAASASSSPAGLYLRRRTICRTWLVRSRITFGSPTR